MINYSKTRRACYFSYLAMASVFSLPPMLFVTFHEMYSISYSLLGTLILVNFCTQLAIDLIFTFFSNKFNITLTVRVMPLLTSAGLIIYAVVPWIWPEHAKIGLIAGTIVFSVAAGLCEVLLSPIVAALPSEHPDRDMSFLHSLYGWGVLMVVSLSSLYFKLFGTVNWKYIVLFWAFLPLISSFLFFISPIPDMKLGGESKKATGEKRGLGIFMCAVCIFLGSSSENIMTGWISSFMEKALLVPKAIGDVLGMAVFAMLLVLARSLYAKFGKNISRTLVFGMAGACACYLVAGFSTNVYISFVACILTGFCTSMLWPGTLIMLEEKVSSPGVAAYALMAAAGDLGASIAPQGVGIIVDSVSLGKIPADLFGTSSETLVQAGMRIGMICAAAFPLIGLLWMFLIIKKLPSKKKEN